MAISLAKFLYRTEMPMNISDSLQKRKKVTVAPLVLDFCAGLYEDNIFGK